MLAWWWLIIAAVAGGAVVLIGIVAFVRWLERREAWRDINGL